MRDQGVQNLQEAVRYVPGVNADSFGFDSRSDNVVIRGVPAAYFIDGLRTTMGFYYTSAMIEPYALERVEVLRGPAAMLYGQTPAGGIINGVSKLPSAIAYNEVSLEYGSYNHRALKIDSTGPLTTDGKWLYRITGLARNADTQVDFVENDRYMIQPSITYKPNLDTTVTLLVNLRKDDSGSVQQFGPIQGTLEPVPGLGRMSRNTFLGEPGDFYNTEQQSVSLLFDHKFNSALSMHHGMRYTHTDVAYDTTLPLILTPYRLGLINAVVGPSIQQAFQLPFTPTIDGSLMPFVGAPGQVPRTRLTQDTTTDNFNSDTYLTARLDTGGIKHKVTAGVDYMRYSSHTSRTGVIDNLYTDPSFPIQTPFNIFNPIYGQQTGNTIPILGFDTPRPTEVQEQLGAYIQDQIKLGPWTGILGVRHDALNLERGSFTDQASAVTWRGGLMYETKFGLTPYVSYGQSFTPQLGTPVADTLAIFAPLNERPAGPREGEQIEIGVKFQPKGSPIAINAAVYELKESNLTVSADTFTNTLIGAATRTRGFELEVIGQVTREFKVMGAYAYTDAKYTSYPDALDAPGALAEKTGTPVEFAPKHMASLWGIYTVPDGPLRGFSIGAGARYVGSMTDIAPLLNFDGSPAPLASVKTPSYTLFDAMMAYETPTWRWQLNAQNLEDEYYITTCQVFRGDCAIGQGRTIVTSYTHKF